MGAASRPDHLLTLDEWDALGDDDTYRWAELVEGVVQVSPSPASTHQLALFAIMKQLDLALAGTELTLIGNMDVVLTARFPPTVRQPDVVVLPATALAAFPTRLAADDVRVAVEIISPGSRRIDRVEKLADYAGAGVPRYWIVDLDGGVTLDAFHLVDGRYEPVLEGAAGRVTLDAPVLVSLDLDALVP